MLQNFTKTILFFVLLSMSAVANAQTGIAAYKFARTTGATYVPLTGDSTVFSGAYDDGVSNAISLGGSFIYGGTTYTSCYISTNGFITFGAASGIATYTPLSTTAATVLGVIAAYAQDAGGSTVAGANPKISYATVGSEFVVQYQDHANYYNRTADRMNFQIRLNLATNAINIVYGSCTLVGTSTSGATAQVGLRGNTTTWTDNVNNLLLPNVPATTTCNWGDAVTGNANTSSLVYSAGTNTSITIPTGLTYTWTPATSPLPVRTFNAVSNITATAATISWAPSISSPNGYNLQYRALGSCAWTNYASNPVTGDTIVTLNGLSAGTVYQVRVQSVAGGSVSIWSHIPTGAGGTGTNGYIAAGTFTTSVTCPVPTAVTVGSITTSSASVTFTSTGSSFIVEYGATGFTPGTGATAGTGGTIITSSSSPVSISGLSAGTYQVYVRQNCTAAGNGYSGNSTAVSFSPIPSSCATNTFPANGATGITPPIAFSWSAVPSASSYTLYIGTANPPVDSITTVTTNSVTITGGAPNTTYYWYVVPKNTSGAATGCSANATRYTTGGSPANDACANAVNLTVSAGFCTVPVLGSLAFSDTTAGLATASCQSSALKFDVWYRVTMPASGNVTVQTSAVNTITTDLVLQAYSGACGTLTAIGCDDDGNPNSAPSANHSKLGLTGRTPGEVIYYRVMPYNSATNMGAFSICAFDTTASVMPAIAAGTRGTCTPAVAVVADSAWKYSWVPLKDAAGNIIAELYPNGNVLGNTNASFYINSGAVRQDVASIYYLDRNITITPTTQPTSNVTTRLYFTNAELTTFASAAGTTTRSQLNVSKTNQTCATSATAAGAVLLAQSANAAYGTDHYVEVANSSFSTFYLHKGSTPLPIKFEYLTGKKAGTTNALNWKVTCTSTSITMVLERSADARNFSQVVTTINATQARCGQPFDAVDATPINGINYYRLKMIDIDGKVSYSPIAAVLNGKAGAELVGVYPTVVKDQAYLSVTSSRNTTMQFSISDMSGKVIKTINQSVSSGSSMLPVSTSNLATGVYNITGLLDGVRTQTLRFVKQ